MNANTFVCQLPQQSQNKIKELVTIYLTKEGYEKDYIEETILNVMDDRLWNIDEIVDISQFVM